MQLLAVALQRETDVVFARQRARYVAELLGFQKQDQTRISTAVSEIARNAFEYAGGGRIEVVFEKHLSPQELSIRIVDKGPGIANLHLVLSGRYQSASGLGQGIIGTRRLVDRFSIESEPGVGTCVTLGKTLPRNTPSLNQAALQAIADKIASQRESDPLREFRQQSQDLLVSLDEQRQAQDELRRLNESLEQRVAERTAALADSQESLLQARKIEALGQMTGAVAHDFNNLLAIILGNLEILQRRLDAYPDLAKLASNAERAGLRGQKMVQDLLAFARRQPLEPQVLDVPSVIIGLQEGLQQLLPQGIELSLALGANVRPVFIDQNQLERAVLNLAMNGRDAIAGNAGTITIEAETAVVEDGEPRSGAADAVPGSYVRVTVRDTGTGMPPEVRSRAFEPFFTTKAPGQGTGLGLSQVYGFMRQSKGHVSIESHEGGGGTAIHLFLPVAAT